MLLARTLGMTLREAKERIDSREFTTWIAEHELCPWGEDRADIQAASISRYVVMAHTGKSFPQLTFMPDLSPQDRGEKTEQTVDEMRAALQMTAAGGK